MEENKFYKIILFLYGLVYVGIGLRIFQLFWKTKTYVTNSRIVNKEAAIPAINLIIIIAGLYLIMCGMGILMRKGWARKNALFIAYLSGLFFLITITRALSKYVIGSMLNPLFIVNLFLSVIFPIYFFTRPKIKGMFK